MKIWASIVIIIIILCFNTISKAQAPMVDFLPGQTHDTDLSSFTFSVYVGANSVYSIAAIQIPDMNPLDVTPLFGVYGGFELSEKLRLEVGLGYIFFGAKCLEYGEESDAVAIDSPTYGKQNVVKVGYVTVPLTIKYALSNKSSVLGGIRLSGMTYNFSHIRRAYFNKQHQYIQVDIYADNGFDLPHNQMDIGLMLGYAYRFSKHWSAAVVYNLGFIPIVEQSTINRYNKPAYGDFAFIKSGNNNNSLSIQLSYDFLFRGKNTRNSHNPINGRMPNINW